MSLTVKNSGTAFQLAPVGPHIARCYRIIDLGTQTSVIEGKPKAQKKIAFSFELLGDARMEDGKPFVISKWYTASLHEAANLRKDLEAWRGKTFSDEELDGFDIAKVLGAYCMLQVQHENKNGQDRDRIVALMSMPKGLAKPEGVNDLVSLDFDNFDFQVFDSLHDGLRSRIAASPEFKALKQPANPKPINGGGATSGADFDDDVPW